MSQPNSTGTPLQRAPGSFSPMVQPTNSRPALRRVESSDEEDEPLTINRSRAAAAPQQNVPIPAPLPPRPLYSSSPASSSTSNLQNFSRPTLNTALSSQTARNASPLSVAPKSESFHRGHGRKHSQTQGSFEPTLPTAVNSNLGSMANVNAGLSASQIAAQAAMQHQTHNRQRSQTVPTPINDGSQSRRPSRGGPISPPMLSLTEASGPRDHSFGGQVYQNGLLGGSHGNAAQTAANIVFAKSPSTSPALLPADQESVYRIQPDKPLKTEKSKVKLFSRPAKIGVNKDKDKDTRPGALPSPSKTASYTLGSLQRGNFSTNSLADSMSSAASMYSMANSSSATIRAVDSQQPEKDKEKHKHHFLSRQKAKLSSKDDHHLPLSSAASNSRPVDPSAPSSLYNFNLPPSPGPTSTSFAKSMSGLDLRHGGRALREKKKEEKSDALRESELSYQNSNEWPGPSSLGSVGGIPYQGSAGGSYGYTPSLHGGDPESTKYALNNLGPDDAWPFLKAKLLIIFEGEDLRLPVEDFNRLVTYGFPLSLNFVTNDVSVNIQRCIQKRAPNLIVEDLRDLLATGFSSLDQTLRRTPDERLIPHLVEMWLFTFTSALPYMQAVFLPLDLEFSGHGPLMKPEQARDFWGALPTSFQDPNGNAPASPALEVRRIVLTAYRDIVILPRFDTLKTIFSRLSLESIALSIPATDIISTSPDSFSGGRPSTAMSLDPSHASYGSQTTTLLNGGSSGGGSGNRSRAISNVSYGSEPSGLGIANLPPPPARPFTPSSTHPLHPLNRGQRDKTVEDSSKQLTEMVGRMLQCMSVLASVGVGGGGDEDSQNKMEELTRGLKLNWLGRGRMGRDRRGLVGARVPGGNSMPGRGEAVSVI
ncbi:related to CYC8 General repressor of transcription [Rhynchosporium agropyri]|uniref:Related to CYC8 General repressor of transcription n=1 Tax=Rhynchosporium agropyri TaxID=914238 RepID=A0A1E1JXH3_9HELO|nr:related to CYC8 General repressor of transcription [Rhynchosporium agropyri]